MDIKTENEIEEEKLKMHLKFSHEDTQIPHEPVICPESQAQGKVKKVTKPGTVAKVIESSDFTQVNGNSEKQDSENHDYPKKIVEKSSRKEGSEYLYNFKKLECALNDANSKDKIILKNHSMLHRKKKLFKCPECSYECDQKINLKRHFFIHTKIKLFKCSKCSYACNQNSNLKAHMLIHSDEKLFKCSECSYSCKKKGNLTVHMLSHSAIKLFKCEECDYGCNRKKCLERHILTHRKQKLKCPHCDFECEHKSLLRGHMFAHRKTELLKCSECRYECRSETNLKRHSLTHLRESESEWIWSYRVNEYLMECYYIGEAIIAKSEKMELWNYVKEREISSNDFMEYLFNLKYDLDRRNMVRQKHRILFNVIKERQEKKKKITFPAEEDLERIKERAKQLVENEFEPSMKMITKIKHHVEQLHKKNKNRKKVLKVR